MHRPRPSVLSVVALLAVLAAGCSSDNPTKPPVDDPVPVGENVVLRWNKAILQAIRDTKPGPPQTARALAIVHTCMYDAWAAYDAVAVGTRHGGTLRRPAAERTQGRKSKAISYAAYRSLVDLYPSQKAKFDALMDTLGYGHADTSTDLSTAAGVGNAASAAELAFCHVDGSNQLGDLTPGGASYADYTGYQPMNPPIDQLLPTPLDQIPNPSHWQPLTYVNGAGVRVTPAYICPHWGNVRPFAMTSPQQFRPTPPLDIHSAAFKAQVDELIRFSANLNDTSKAIAEYWADGPNSELPPGHFCLFGQLISARDHHTLDQDVKMFFALTSAVSDAGIAVWDAKRAYDFCRPITAVRWMYNGQTVHAWGGAGQGARDIPGETWRPFQPTTFPTPPFPEYISGHSAFSASAAEILKRFTGSDAFEFSYTTRAHSFKAEPGVAPATDITLTLHSFSEAADEAGISRRYGGIHFLDGDLISRRTGRMCAIQVWAKAASLWNGTATAPRGVTPLAVAFRDGKVAARTH